MEHALISGLNCAAYPDEWEKIGSDDFLNRNFSEKTKITIKDVKVKLESMVIPPEEDHNKRRRRGDLTKERDYSICIKDKLKMTVLYFLCSVLVSNEKDGTHIDEKCLAIVDDLDACRWFDEGIRVGDREETQAVTHEKVCGEYQDGGQDIIDEGVREEVPTDNTARPLPTTTFGDCIRMICELKAHVDCKAMYGIIKRPRKYPNVFNQDRFVLDDLFIQLLLLKSKNERIDDDIMKYVHGKLPKLEKSWKGAKALYFPFNINDTHWVAVKADFISREFVVFYSSLGCYTDKVMGTHLASFTKIIP
ncbi:hypothetical protein L484_023960 [Morus notabilis]|uniref:Ubiquitin-like protease family profile domain-containing protein n=1 Tax=Morus notabilis TaxID=981085 RepID=W9R0N9_9ROSA|nr:hypothetical protein L484_023960 [Morus notabilis]